MEDALVDSARQPTPGSTVKCYSNQESGKKVEYLNWTTAVRNKTTKKQSSLPSRNFWSVEEGEKARLKGKINNDHVAAE